MVKFTHMADIHLGAWRQEKMEKLSFESFQFIINKSIERKVDFVVIAGDLFDSAYPPIEVLKNTFAEFRKLKEAKIPVFIIAGSHDYLASGKSFLDVLEKAGFCKNVHSSEEINGILHLSPTIYEGVAFYGYPAKKSSLEVRELKNFKLIDAPGMMKIVLLHTSLDKIRAMVTDKVVHAEELPKADYYAFGHIHTDFKYRNMVYPGVPFPTNFSELETVQNGTFFIIDTEDANNQYEKIEIKLKEIEIIKIRPINAITTTRNVIDGIQNKNLKDKIVLLKFTGQIEQGKLTDIDFQKIEDAVIDAGAYFVLRNTQDLSQRELGFDFVVKDKSNLEEEVIEKYSDENPSKFNFLAKNLIDILSIEKEDGETINSFNERLLDDSRRALGI